MDVAVHEPRRHESAVEILHVSVWELVAADVVAAQPGDDIAAHRHRGGFGVGGAVHPAVDQEFDGNLAHTANSTPAMEVLRLPEGAEGSTARHL